MSEYLPLEALKVCPTTCGLWLGGWSPARIQSDRPLAGKFHGLSPPLCCLGSAASGSLDLAKIP